MGGGGGKGEGGRFSLVSGMLYFFLFQRKLYILFLISFLIYFGIVKIWHMYHNLEKRVWFRSIFLPFKESLTLFQTWKCLLYLRLFCPILSYREQRYQNQPSIFMEIVTILIVLVDQFYFNMHQPIKIWLFEKITFELVFIFAFSFSFKTICILLAQVIALKKIVISSAQFAISMPWSPICISLILLPTLIKLTSTSAAILSNSTES